MTFRFIQGSMFCFALACSIISGCKKQAAADSHGALAEPGGANGNASDPHALSLKLRRLSPGTGYEGQWTVSESAEPSQILFRVELQATQSSQGFAFGKGTLSSVGGAKGKDFLLHLSTVMEAKQLPTSVKHIAKLDITDAILGLNMSRIPGGGFQEKPKGEWVATKLFLPIGEDTAEVFFNMSPETGDAELAEKDADYGDEVVAAFAKLF